MKRRLINLAFVALSFSIVMVAALFIWVLTGPRSINSLTPYIEKSLSSSTLGYSVKIESSEIKWEGWHTPLAVSAKNVEVISDKGVVLSYFPEVVMKIYLHKLVIGKIDVKSLELIHPSMTLVQNGEGGISLGLTDNASAGGSAAAIMGVLTSGEDSDNPLGHLQALSVQHAAFTIKNKLSQTILESSDASLEARKKRGKIKGVFHMPLLFQDKPGDISAEFTVDKVGDLISTDVSCNTIPVPSIHQLLPTLDWLEGANFPFSGTAHVTSHFNGYIDAIDFKLETGQGNLKYPQQLDGTINLQKVEVSGSVTDNLTTLKVTSGELAAISSESKTITALFNGMIKKVGDEYSVDGFGKTTNVPVNDIHLFWPPALSPTPRQWAMTNISNGTLAKADVILHFKPGEIKLKSMPEGALSSTLEIKNATVKYLPDYPPVTNVDGVLKFTGKSMDAKISSADYMTGSKITDTSIQMPDMYPSDVKMLINMHVAAPAQDIGTFLTLPGIEKADTLGLTKDISGQASGDIKLDFIAFSEGNAKHNGTINYTIDGNLTDVSQNRFLHNYDIEKANTKITVDNKGIKLAGNVIVNKVPMRIDLTTDFKKDYPTQYQIQSDMPVAMMKNFGFPPLDFATGVMQVNASFVKSDKADTTKASIDLTDTDIELSKYGFSKKKGDNATLEYSAEKNASGNTTIHSLTLKGNNLNLSGTGEYADARSEISALTFNQVHFGSTDLNNLDYRKTAEGIKVTAEGNAFDLSPYLDNGKREKPENYDVSIKTNHLIFGDKREMHSASLQAACATICSSVAVNAKLPGGAPFIYSIKSGALNAATDNAGELIRVLGVSDTVTGGKMSLTGKYVNNKIEGDLRMSEYTLSKAPILTKMLTIASLTGFLNTLTGNGIVFDKLYAPFTYADGFVVVKDAKTHGSALGITADGTIDTVQSKLDLTGLLIPSYTMNTLIGNVPLIGDLLMGGHNMGIIGMNYSVKGSINDPSVSVNPLSALTPGFLRGIFDVFDQPPPDIDKITAERKNAAEKANAPAAPEPVPPAPANAPQNPPSQ